MNILANGVYNNQKILFASKNNKAVDNVYERMNKALNTHYFIRLGSNDINKNALVTIQVFTKLINDHTIVDHTKNFAEAQQQCNVLAKEKEAINDKISQIPILQGTKSDLSTQKYQYEQDFKTWRLHQHESEFNLYITKGLDYSSVVNSEIYEVKKLLTHSKGFFSRILYHFFHKKKVTSFVKKVNRKLPLKLRQFVDTNAPYHSEKSSDIDSFILNLSFILNEKQKQEHMVEQYNQLTQTIKKIEAETGRVVSKLNEYQEHLIENQTRLLEIEKEFIDLSKTTLRLKINQTLYHSNTSVIDSYADYISHEIPWKDKEQKEFSNISKQFLETFQAISISNLTIKKAFLQEPELFDLLIIDEASQCDIASVLPLVFRAKRLVVLGDPLQLPHIASINKNEHQYALDALELSHKEVNYIDDSFFDKATKVSTTNIADTKVSNKSTLFQTFLNEHFRCHPDIIKFSNDNFYLPKAGQSLVIKTNPNDFKFGTPGFNWVDVVGTVDARKNINRKEVEQCVALASSLRAQFPDASIGVTTPFKHQKEQLIKALNHINHITTDTIYGFQGDEKDIMLFSLVVSPNCKSSLPNFLNKYSQNQLNVAITRAKSALYIIGNKAYCENLKTEKNTDTLLAKLAKHDKIVNKG